MGTINKFNIVIAFFVILTSASCVKTVDLTADSDPTPPEVELLINRVPVTTPEDEPLVISMPLSQNIQLLGTAMDAESGVKHVSVGTALTYTCLDREDRKVYSGAGEWSSNKNVPGMLKRTDVDVERLASHNFRLIYLRDQCDRDELFLNAEGELYVSARNYFGKLSQKTYKVIFQPNDPYND